ncbi:hypothetical protein [Rhizobium sp. BK176]|uniref:hypothetical protein n=1 Tax=Rhizobium sp. BK176 TaxID=2587071 RepID=UPI0021672292|nr:hypothetical protein [Rhizobium sp. BK176]MCS4089782.1 hypothetical protein [Rhizobium sp. BK176]
MASKPTAELRKPNDAREFESLCALLYSSILQDAVGLVGRDGQTQNGVDLWGYWKGNIDRIVGVQCKKRMSNVLTKADVKHEYDEAKKFSPTLSDYFIVTTADDDATLQEYARQLSDDYHREGGKFSCKIVGWGELQRLIHRYPDVLSQFDPGFSATLRDFSKAITEQNLRMESVRRNVSQNFGPTQIGQHSTPFQRGQTVFYQYFENGDPDRLPVVFDLSKYAYFRIVPAFGTDDVSLGEILDSVGNGYHRFSPSGEAWPPKIIGDAVLFASPYRVDRNGSRRTLRDGTIISRDGSCYFFEDIGRGCDLLRLGETLKFLCAHIQMLLNCTYDISAGIVCPEGEPIRFVMDRYHLATTTAKNHPITSRTFRSIYNGLNAQIMTDLLESSGIVGCDLKGIYDQLYQRTRHTRELIRPENYTELHEAEF